MAAVSSVPPACACTHTHTPVCVHVHAFSTITHSCLSQPKPPDHFGDTSLTKAIFRKYLKDICSSKLNLKLSFKCFTNISFIPKLFSKLWQVQTTLVKNISRQEWDNQCAHASQDSSIHHYELKKREIFAVTNIEDKSCTPQVSTSHKVR